MLLHFICIRKGPDLCHVLLQTETELGHAVGVTFRASTLKRHVDLLTNCERIYRSGWFLEAIASGVEAIAIRNTEERIRIKFFSIGSIQPGVPRTRAEPNLPVARMR